MLLFLIMILVVLFLLLLSVPIDLEGRAVSGKRPNLRIIWLFGLIKLDLLEARMRAKDRSDEKMRDRNKAAKEPEQEEISAGQRNAEKDGIGWSGQEIMSILQTEGLMGDLKRLLRGLVHAIRIRYLRAHLRIGLQDPADTGQAAGGLWSGASYLQSLYPIELEIEPSFCQEVLEGEGQGALRVWPILMALSLLRFSLSRPALGATLKIIRLFRGKNLNPYPHQKAIILLQN